VANAPQGPSERLELLRGFVNTKDVETAADSLRTPDELADWLTANGLAARGLAAGAADLRRAVDLREALRAALLANNEGTGPEPAAVEVLNRIAERARLVTRFDARGEAALEPVSEGVDGALGRLLAIVYDAMETGDWRRLKVCRNDTCLWAFYDNSKNRSRHWCRMEDCGSQVKARTYRRRKKAEAAEA
jgi:predicted RNA-binding Zn ribbon-like protein